MKVFKEPKELEFLSKLRYIGLSKVHYKGETKMSLVEEKFKFGPRSQKALEGVNANLVKLANKALEVSEVDFVVIEGLRSKERQKDLVSKGLSKTMKSKHLTGKAIDVLPYPVDWKNWSDFVKVYGAFKTASEILDIPFRWGGDWEMKGDFRDEKFLDAPHFELI